MVKRVGKNIEYKQFINVTSANPATSAAFCKKITSVNNNVSLV